MKKIWPWLLLLLLLIVLCVWTKKDSIHISSNIPTQSVAPVIADKEKTYIHYLITQQDNSYSLDGAFTNTQQQDALVNTFKAKERTLKINHTSTNATLVGNEALALTDKIIPHFIQNYTRGKISYNNQKLEISGDVNNYEAQHEMQRLLSSSTIPSQDNTRVVLATKPIDFHINKNGENFTVNGTLKDATQVNALKSKLPASAKVTLKQENRRVDDGAIAATQSILPSFTQNYSNGDITYTDKMLTVAGTVSSQEALNEMQRLTSSLGIPVTNNTVLDPEVLKAQREAEAKKAQEAKKVQEEAEANARETSEKEAQVTTQEAATAEKMALETKAQEEESKKAKVKESINQLLSVEDIEFEVGKSSLTQKGKTTVDKLANILKQYPNMRVELAGYTDSDGSETFNQKLSQARVDTTKNRLISRGVVANRLVAKGYGEANPLVPNTSDENKAKNRRVEINILGE